MADTTIIQIRKVPESVHRALKHAATDQGKSLNQYVVDLLTQAMSFQVAPSTPNKPTKPAS